MNQYQADNLVTVNGTVLHYAAAGEGKPVVLIHGNGEDHNLFSTEIGQLTAAGYRVYAPDSKGHGANEPLPEYHYADMAEDVYGFITALGLKRPALYGHSDGVGGEGQCICLSVPSGKVRECRSADSQEFPESE